MSPTKNDDGLYPSCTSPRCMSDSKQCPINQLHALESEIELNATLELQRYRYAQLFGTNPSKKNYISYMESIANINALDVIDNDACRRCFANFQLRVIDNLDKRIQRKQRR